MTQKRLIELRNAITIIRGMTDEELEELIPEAAVMDYPSKKSNSTNGNVEKILEKARVNKATLGYNFLKEAVTLVANNPSKYHRKFLKVLYPEISKKTGFAVQRIQTEISNAICNACKEKNGFFEIGSIPSNTKFINTIAEYAMK